MENMDTGFMLMGIGMTTVFAILLIVIYLGKGLTILINKYAPEEVTKKIIPDSASTIPTNTIQGATLAAITSAVSTVTQGKGKIIKVEKL